MLKKITLLYLGSSGAGPVYSLEMAKALVESGRCELQIIISKEIKNIDSWYNYFQDHQLKNFITIDTYKHSSLSVLFSFFNIIKIKALIDIISKFKPDYLYLPFGLMWAPIIFPIIYKKIRIIDTLHDPHPHDISKNLFIKMFNKLIDYSFRYVTDIIILNNRDFDYVKKKYKKNVFVIPHASFHYYFKQNSIIPKLEKNLNYTIGFLGRIEPYKGLDLLVEAFDNIHIHQLKLIIAGNGVLPAELKKKIEANDNIILINRYIEDNEFSEILDSIDIVVLPYKRASQSGVVPMAFAAAKMVIVTDVGALKEQVPIDTGIVVHADCKSIAYAIQSLYKNPNQILQYGNNAKKYADSILTWQYSAKLFFKIVYSE